MTQILLQEHRHLNEDVILFLDDLTLQMNI
jgi:hypothetical protein